MRKPIALQLRHPDAFFYDLSAKKEGVFGMFQGEQIEPFSIDFKQFINAAYTLNWIADYDEHTGKVYIADEYEGTDMKAVDWVRYLISENDTATQEILTFAIQVEFDEKVKQAARDIMSGVASDGVTRRIYRSVDTAFCDSVQYLAQVVQFANEG